jgi:hypothetical protein
MEGLFSIWYGGEVRWGWLYKDGFILQASLCLCEVVIVLRCLGERYYGETVASGQEKQWRKSYIVV